MTVRLAILLGLLCSVSAWGEDLRAGPLPTRPTAYRLQVGDQLEIKFFYNSDLNETVTIRPDGCLSLQLVGEVVAAGKTPAQLADELRTDYGKHLRDPEVAVIVRSFPPPQVFVGGEIGRPGAVGIPGRVTLVQALTLAGGPKRSARLSEVVIVRNDPVEGRQIIKTDVRPILNGDAGAEDPVLQAFDIVLVPRTKIARVNDWVDQFLRLNLPFNVTVGLFATPY
jgi:polysaccharide biosynthesis/export protein